MAAAENANLNFLSKFAGDFQPCEDSTTIFVKYLGRIRMSTTANAQSCLQALERLSQTTADQRGGTMEMTVSCARGAVILAGHEEVMKHSLMQIACASTKGPLLCYALAVPLADTQTKQYIFVAHGFEVRPILFCSIFSFFFLRFRGVVRELHQRDFLLLKSSWTLHVSFNPDWQCNSMPMAQYITAQISKACSSINAHCRSRRSPSFSSATVAAASLPPTLPPLNVAPKQHAWDGQSEQAQKDSAAPAPAVPAAPSGGAVDSAREYAPLGPATSASQRLLLYHYGLVESPAPRAATDLPTPRGAERGLCPFVAAQCVKEKSSLPRGDIYNECCGTRTPCTCVS